MKKIYLVIVALFLIAIESSVLQAATQLEYKKITELLETRNFKVIKTLSKEDQHVAFFHAVQEEKIDWLDKLIAAGIDVNVLNWSGGTYLHTAANLGFIKGIESLIRAGADVNVQNNWGLIALHGAILNRHKDAVNLLIKAKANLKTKDIWGRDAFAAAQEYLCDGEDCKEILRLLNKKD